jgi:hypothetical protein
MIGGYQAGAQHKSIFLGRDQFRPVGSSCIGLPCLSLLKGVLDLICGLDSKTAVGYLQSMAGSSGGTSDLPPALHRAILCVDVEGFGNRRTNLDQLAVREGLYRCLRTALDKSDITFDACYYEDRGDGIFFLIPPDIPKQSLVSPFLQEISAALYSYNKSCAVRARIRLRLVLHAGEVHRDRYGVAGDAINLAFRLLEAEALKQALATSTGLLAVITFPRVILPRIARSRSR